MNQEPWCCIWNCSFIPTSSKSYHTQDNCVHTFLAICISLDQLPSLIQNLNSCPSYSLSKSLASCLSLADEVIVFALCESHPSYSILVIHISLLLCRGQCISKASNLSNHRDHIIKLVNCWANTLYVQEHMDCHPQDLVYMGGYGPRFQPHRQTKLKGLIDSSSSYHHHA